VRAFVFPGQGSQYVGMGKALAERHPVAQKTFDEADAALGEKLSRLIFEGPIETLTETANNQPAILTTSIAFWRVLQELKGSALDCGVLAGHSLGEYSALVAAGSLGFADAVRLVRARGRFMQEAVPLGKGTMAAVIGLDAAKVEELCAASTQPGDVVEPAGFNCPGQIIVAGHVAAVQRLMTAVEAAGGKPIGLNVSGPFHSSPLRVAGERLAKELAAVKISAPSVPYVPNVTGEPARDASAIAKNLIDQVSRPVRWEASMRAMIALGAKELVEVGPGRVLIGFVKKLDRKFPTQGTDDEKGWAALTA
jgi:[acyl-carrier-protein] S-malonyltransferase